MSGRARADDGSVLLLMPAAVLIVLVLGAMAFDLSHRHVAERQLRGAAAEAANDAVAVGLDQARLRHGGSLGLDVAAAEAAALRSLASHRPAAVEILEARVTIGTDDTVAITVAAEVSPTFARAFPGSMPSRLTVTASARPGHR